MQELIEFVAKKLVAHPDDVQVTKIDAEDCQNYELRVNPEDMGRIIGRSGRTAKPFARSSARLRPRRTSR